MQGPRMVSVIERRLLVNYRTDPEITARLLPAPLRPQVVGGWAVSGLCLIRLGGVRPAAIPVPFGLRSENAAHRIAVEWDTPDGVERGVYIPRRDTGSRLTGWAGGRLFPGRHHRSRVGVRESDDELRINVEDDSTGVRAEVHVRTAATLSGSRLFTDTGQASEFFRCGGAGFSTTPNPARLDGVRLLTHDWRVSPVELVSVRSTFFDDPVRFPPGSAIADCGLLMRDVAATWVPLPRMTVRPAGDPVTAPVR
ncbi:DUF2071 domain-containing protein [Actinoplanes xinjiangensis]|uniref:Uncharacterized protein DUF2071 n=1 Tax=Actinoplanes xinjiangensis TaxID=512350 RepID=A0A316FH69_9ACTN|nr:DUF2071 domain-containing protein [Actinoplanes xinjiangensis]PWK48268.1 uncharacterized protein DUF2071 [Actinoplanes xinjiangensis]GIF38977.1 hypothetical protein Axi01nite_32880 [Actinoplanes xinjiangensis]